MYEFGEIIFLIVAFIASVISTAVGFGGSLILLPISAILLPVKKAIAIVVIYFIANNITKIYLFFKHIDCKLTFLQFVLGIPLTILSDLKRYNIGLPESSNKYFTSPAVINIRYSII